MCAGWVRIKKEGGLEIVSGQGDIKEVTCSANGSMQAGCDITSCSKRREFFNFHQRLNLFIL